MKTHLFLFSCASAFALVSCNRTTFRQDLVKETYIHKYGVELPKNDWNSQGKDGQVVKALKDGITVTENYQNGELEGATTYTFPHSSTIQKTVVFVNGTKQSEIIHYPSGVPLQEECFENDQLVQFTGWYEDGSPCMIEYYENGLLVSGEYRNTMNSVDSRIQEGQGVRLIRDSDGLLVNKDLIQNGLMTERVCYFASGEPSSITAFENGHIHGKRMTFLPGGLPSTVEQWERGLQEGVTVTYQNGEKFSEIPYHFGKKQGIEKRYKDGEELVEEISWVGDLQHGPRSITATGQTKTEWFHQGEQVSRITFERLNLR